MHTRQVLSSSARCRYFAIAERSPRFLNGEHVKLQKLAKSLTCACFVILALAGCLPLSLGTIDLGVGRSFEDMLEVETVLANNGFSQDELVVAGKPVPRIENKERFYSGFSSSLKGVEVAVTLYTSDGHLDVTLGQRNDKLTPEVIEVLMKLQRDLKPAFGPDISLKMCDDCGPPMM